MEFFFLLTLELMVEQTYKGLKHSFFLERCYINKITIIVITKPRPIRLNQGFPNFSAPDPQNHVSRHLQPPLSMEVNTNHTHTLHTHTLVGLSKHNSPIIILYVRDNVLFYFGESSSEHLRVRTSVAEMRDLCCFITYLNPPLLDLKVAQSMRSNFEKCRHTPALIAMWLPLK